jgi:hypothetical protein
MNRYAFVVQNPMNRLSGHVAKARTPLSHPVQKLCEDFIGSDQSHFSERLTDLNCLSAILIARVKRGAPVKRIHEDLAHFFFGAPWR